MLVNTLGLVNTLTPSGGVTTVTGNIVTSLQPFSQTATGLIGAVAVNGVISQTSPSFSQNAIGNVLPSIVSVTSPLLDASSGNVLTLSNFPNVTSIKLIANGVTEDMLSITGSGDSYLFNMPDKSSYTSGTVGVPFTSGTYTDHVIEVTSANITMTIPVVVNPITGWAVQDIVGAVIAEGSVFGDYTPPAPSNNSQYYYDTLSGTVTVDTTGVFSSNSGFQGVFWDVDTDTFYESDTVINTTSSITQSLNSFLQSANGNVLQSTVLGTISQSISQFTQLSSGIVGQLSVTSSITQSMNTFIQSGNGTAPVPGNINGVMLQSVNAFTQVSSGLLSVPQVIGDITQSLSTFTQSSVGIIDIPNISGVASQTVNAFTINMVGTIGFGSDSTGVSMQVMQPFSTSLLGIAYPIPPIPTLRTINKTSILTSVHRR